MVPMIKKWVQSCAGFNTTPTLEYLLTIDIPLIIYIFQVKVYNVHYLCHTIPQFKLKVK